MMDRDPVSPSLEIRRALGIGSSPARRPLNESLARVIGSEDRFLERGPFTPNRPHVVAEGLATLEKASFNHWTLESCCGDMIGGGKSGSGEAIRC